MKKRLDQLLFERGLSDSRSKASALIMSGNVYVEGVRRDKPGWQVVDDTTITIKESPQYVSRAGQKLASANEKLKLDMHGKTVLDIGSSTGGFSDYCLQNGAQKIYAVDVGTHQLHERLRNDPRVVVMEQTDIRNAQLPEKVDIVVADVSFISLRQIIPVIGRFIKPDGSILVMCKPQFEAGAAEASKHKGVIKNDTLRRRILKDFEDWLKQHGYRVRGKADSEVSGSKGNIERFYLLDPK